MAILIDSLGNLDHTVRRKFKKVFAQLSDDYIVRTPAHESIQVADLIVEGPNNSWILIGIHQSKPKSEEITKYQSFSLVLKQTYNSWVRYLAVTETGESLFDEQGASLPYLVTLERDGFFSNGADLVIKYMNSLSDAAHDWLKKTVFSEININPACTTRREVIYRNNSAQLQPFFLDYNQEMATKLDIIGEPVNSEEEETDNYFVRLINGVAGCGKTLILINRAILYCKKFPERKVLFLIHNKPITSDIEYKFDKYLNGVPENLTIKTFHAFALAQKKSVSGYLSPIFSSKDLKPLKEKILGDINSMRKELSLSDDQLWSEIEYINEFLITDKQAYMDTDRQGRGYALQKPQRDLVWQLYEQAMNSMSGPKGYLPSLYIRELCLAAGIDDKLEKFDHILLDEAQFFFPSWLQLVLRSLKESGQLFMCADPNQGFLKSRLSWKSVGLNVRGRTKKLSYSYRTTYEILIAANALLEHLNDDPEEFIKPDLENMIRGGKPHVVYSDTPQDELKRFLNELKSTTNNKGLPLNQILVLCSESGNPWSIKRSIERELGKDSVVNFNDRKDLSKDFSGKVKLMSINSCTGMEAGITFVLGVGDILDSENNLDLNDEEKLIKHQESIRKLYVAMTRAGQKLVLFSTEKLPEYVEAYMEIA